MSFQFLKSPNKPSNLSPPNDLTHNLNILPFVAPQALNQRNSANPKREGLKPADLLQAANVLDELLALLRWCDDRLFLLSVHVFMSCIIILNLVTWGKNREAGEKHLVTTQHSTQLQQHLVALNY